VRNLGSTTFSRDWCVSSEEFFESEEEEFDVGDAPEVCPEALDFGVE
jgi:hypothetical protein